MVFRGPHWVIYSSGPFSELVVSIHTQSLSVHVSIINLFYSIIYIQSQVLDIQVIGDVIKDRPMSVTSSNAHLPNNHFSEMIGEFQHGYKDLFYASFRQIWRNIGVKVALFLLCLLYQHNHFAQRLLKRYYDGRWIKRKTVEGRS